MLGLDPMLLLAITHAEDYLAIAKNVYSDDCFYDCLEKAKKVIEEELKNRKPPNGLVS